MEQKHTFDKLFSQLVSDLKQGIKADNKDVSEFCSETLERFNSRGGSRLYLESLKERRLIELQEKFNA